MKMSISLFSLIFSSLLLGTALVAAHPADPYEPSTPDAMYGMQNYGMPAEWSIGDLVFSAPYPAVSTLSRAERYFLAGADSSASGYPLAPWKDRITDFVIAYFNRYGEVPESVNEESLKAISPYPTSLGYAALQWWKSPISDEMPRLNQPEFSRGDFYIRVLTEAEIQHFAELMPDLDNAYNNGVRVNPITGETFEIELLSPILYVRAYGESEVLHSEIDYHFRTIE